VSHLEEVPVAKTAAAGKCKEQAKLVTVAYCDPLQLLAVTVNDHHRAGWVAWRSEVRQAEEVKVMESTFDSAGAREIQAHYRQKLAAGARLVLLTPYHDGFEEGRFRREAGRVGLYVRIENEVKSRVHCIGVFPEGTLLRRQRSSSACTAEHSAATTS